MEPPLDYLPALYGQPEGKLDAYLWELLDGYEDERLPLLTANEARATVTLLQLLASGDGEGHEAALDLASRIGRRLPSQD
jgi:hypothetical protein